MSIFFGLAMIALVAVPSILVGMVIGCVLTLATVHRQSIYSFFSRLFTAPPSN